MDTSRFRIDPFACALGGLALLTLAFVVERNGAAVIMCGLCFAGLVAARWVGFSGRALMPLAVGLVVILLMVWSAQPLSAWQTSTLAHLAGGALVGWVLAESLRTRLGWPAWALVVLAGVCMLTVVWELGEYLGDRTFETALIPTRRSTSSSAAWVGQSGSASSGCCCSCGAALHADAHPVPEDLRRLAACDDRDPQRERDARQATAPELPPGLPLERHPDDVSPGPTHDALGADDTSLAAQ
jgi:hypothetical protein